jgi:hypothetical protein
MGDNVTNVRNTSSQLAGDPPIVGTNKRTGDDMIDRTSYLEKSIYSFNSDMEYGVFENIDDAVSRLPSSLFYEAQSSEDGRSGLFNYYVIGDSRMSAGGVKVTYVKSETYEMNQSITPEVSRNPTAQAIIKETTTSGNYLNPSSKYVSQPYNVKDFIFCKHYGVIPNNRMITLRRFPNPVMDNLRVPTPGKRAQLTDEGGKVKGSFVDGDGITTSQMIREGAALPMAQAVTFFGGETGNSLDSILGIDSGLKWSNPTQSTKLDLIGNDRGLLNSTLGKYMEGILSQETNDNLKSISNLLGTFTDPDNVELQLRRQLFDKLTSGDGPLSKKIFVDVNTVNQMHIRDIGFSGGQQAFTLKFTYSLTSVGEVNSRMLFIDLLANLLAIGTDYGKFLTPQLLVNSTRQGLGFPMGNKGYVMHLTQPVEFLNSMLKLNFSAEVKSKIENLQGDVEKSKEELEGLKKGTPLSKDGKIYKTLTAMLTSDLISQLYYEPIMLSGYPTGEWHVTVGNPLNPIAMMGNLICDNVKIKLNNILGPDDFPTELTAEYSLKAARQKHRGDFESMFNRGNGRLYLGKFEISDASEGALVGARSGTDIQKLKGNIRDQATSLAY